MALLNEDHGRFKTFSRRALMLGGGKLALLGLLAGRMYYLQVVEGEKYATLAEDNRVSLRLLPPPRGRILDRFGAPLAVNNQNYRVLLVAEQANDMTTTLDRLTRIIPIDESDRERILREVRQKRAFVPVTVRENLSWEKVSQVEVNAPDLAGISIDVGQTRHYPHGAEMAHVLGYVAAVAEHELTGDPLLELPGFRVGKSGLEKRYDEKLRGSAGTSQVEVNAVGRTIRELKREEGQPGSDLILTLDGELQGFVQRRLSGEKSASSIVLDVETGDVLAMGSVPSYDPNAFNFGLSNSEWRALVNNPQHPLTNKAIGGLYNPGSTFKMVVALAALEAGIGAGHEVYCPGFYKLGNARFHCWRRWGHGKLNMVEGIKNSCDVYFYELARRVGIDRIAEMAKRFGLGETVGIDLPGERGGTVPTKEWKRAYIGEPWQGGETLVAAIGQGFVLTTPLQLAVMTARLASGKAVRPHLAHGLSGRDEDVTPVVERAFPDLEVPLPHLDVVRAGMDAVVNEKGGTAYGKRIRQEGWEMAGKTGTAQVRRITMAERRQGVIKNEDLPWRRRDHALFVGFAPVDKPRYCCAVVVEHGGGGSTTAAPIVRDVLVETQRRDPARRGAPAQVAGKPAGTET
ncbi:penicillin-binding protein 2 [Ferruginivarius sediminum]|uniref:Penicillin-binding protein 2 n=1 Tax=Ferruginivarius sediminum TaxID=2661937 RepID=A0A369TFL5_9PROT|nr:penicillin-binding protein 2 [Ferruginivarius sediminum]RDD63612.1 penicillin-binding protein 2 [Ferruginivarius sediminum]